MDCQTGLWMLVTAELCKAGSDQEHVSQPSRWHRWARALASAYRAVRGRLAVEPSITNAEQLEG